MDADGPFPELRKTLEELIEKLGGEGALDYRTYGAQDGEWIRILTLFAGYHRFYQELDAHLQREQDQTSPCAFSHGDGCMDYLQRGGFSEEEATWYVGVFYQLRRAHRAIREFLVGETSCMMSFKARLWSHLFTHDIRHYETCMWERMEDFSLLLVGETGRERGMPPKLWGFRATSLRTQNTKVCHDSSGHVCRYQPVAIQSVLGGVRTFWPSQRCLYRCLEGS